MDLALPLQTLLSAPILFFALGVVATLIGSDLEVPQPIARFLSLYLLLAIGVHGGHALHRTGFTLEIALVLAAAVVMAVAVPLYTFPLVRERLGVHDAGAIAATYGSVSAVTFVTATALLASLDIPYGGHMVAALALMESPAILVSVWLVRRAAGTPQGGAPLGDVLREAAVNGSVVLLTGSLVIGFVAGESGWRDLGPFTEDIFRGMLSFFLLDMGLLAARRARALASSGLFLPAFAVAAPLVNAAGGLGVAAALALPEGDAILFMTLSASASYIAVPAAMRLTLPEANPSLYVSMALGLTFPFNVLVGIPLYGTIVRYLWS